MNDTPPSSDIPQIAMQYRFIETLQSSLSAPFRNPEDIIEHYTKLGYVDIELRHAIDSEGNILAYSFEVLCYKTENGKASDKPSCKAAENSAPFVKGV